MVIFSQFDSEFILRREADLTELLNRIIEMDDENFRGEFIHIESMGSQVLD